MRLYVPAGHAWQPLDVCVNPALHWQSVLPGTEVVLPVHATHTPPVYCVSAGHAEQFRFVFAEHSPPFDMYPALQVQSVCDPLPGAAKELAGHKLQFGLPSGDHCPSGQLRHVSFPVAP
jgi:hypothetical protein